MVERGGYGGELGRREVGRSCHQWRRGRSSLEDVVPGPGAVPVGAKVVVGVTPELDVGLDVLVLLRAAVTVVVVGGVVFVGLGLPPPAWANSIRP